MPEETGASDLRQRLVEIQERLERIRARGKGAPPSAPPPQPSGGSGPPPEIGALRKELDEVKVALDRLGPELRGEMEARIGRLLSLVETQGGEVRSLRDYVGTLVEHVPKGTEKLYERLGGLEATMQTIAEEVRKARAGPADPAPVEAQAVPEAVVTAEGLSLPLPQDLHPTLRVPKPTPLEPPAPPPPSESQRTPLFTTVSPHLVGGLVVAAVILTLGTLTLLQDVTAFLVNGQGDVARATAAFIVLLLTGYGAAACVRGLWRLRARSRGVPAPPPPKPDPLILEEVVRNRVLLESLAQKVGEVRRGPVEPTPSPTVVAEGFALEVAVLAILTMGLFVYLALYPFEMVAYTALLLAVAWWFVFARRFRLLLDPRAWYLVALFVLVVPTLSFVLRAAMEAHQVLYVVFLLLLAFACATYYRLRALATGQGLRALLRAAWAARGSRTAGGDRTLLRTCSAVLASLGRQGLLDPERCTTVEENGTTAVRILSGGCKGVSACDPSRCSAALAFSTVLEASLGRPHRVQASLEPEGGCTLRVAPGGG